jgi:hypothetical protein
MRILIGIDDTDNLDSPGTGSLARNICAELVSKGYKSFGVTRHQFLFDRAIPYTSHNSGACIEVQGPGDKDEVQFIFDHVAKVSAEGSDPGVCIAYKDDVDQQIVDFGISAQQIILKIEDSFKTAKGKPVKLYGLGGDCLGVIGALGSVGQRAGGNHGRFVDMPGLRDLPRRLNIDEYNSIGVEVEYKIEDRQPESTDEYDTLDWARPELKNGKAVLTVEWSKEKNAWIPANRKKNKS